MKEYSTKEIRNVVLLGATKSGKTTLSEAMLFEGKVIDRRGSVEEKNTVSDNDELEKINQRSIYATPLYAEFMGAKVYLQTWVKVKENWRDNVNFIRDVGYRED